MYVKKKETEFLTEEEAQAMLRVPDRRTLQGKRDYAILLTPLSTGLRKAEICNPKVGDLKTYRNQTVVDIVGKGKRFRRIPLRPETLHAIQDYLKARPPPKVKVPSLAIYLDNSESQISSPHSFYADPDYPMDSYVS